MGALNKRTVWAAVGILVALVLAGGVLVGMSGVTSGEPTWDGHTAKELGIPAERISPLGCDYLNGDSVCGQRVIFLRLCGLDVRTMQREVDVDTMAIKWILHDTPMLLVKSDYPPSYICLASGRTFTLTDDMNLWGPGPESRLPEILKPGTHVDEPATEAPTTTTATSDSEDQKLATWIRTYQRVFGSLPTETSEEIRGFSGTACNMADAGKSYEQIRALAANDYQMGNADSWAAIQATKAAYCSGMPIE